MKPREYDNSWLGVMGATMATLFNADGKAIGTCLDAPNPVAHAMANHPEITSASGLLGIRQRAELEDRFWFTATDEKLGQSLTIF